MDWRLIFDQPAEGAWNMGLDEALLETAGRAGQGGCLRFYGWSQPTVSLGYFQRYEDRRLHVSSRDCPLVRRATGGGAIVHDVDLTYSVTLPVRDHVQAGLRVFYDVLHRTLIEELATWGVTATWCVGADEGGKRQEPFLCFQRRCEGDVLVDGMKIGGSAQRRHKTGLLQHGSVLLGRSPAAPELPGIEDLGKIRIDPSELAHRWARRIGGRIGVDLAVTTPTEEEFLLARSFQQEKFLCDPWNRRR